MIPRRCSCGESERGRHELGSLIAGPVALAHGQRPHVGPDGLDMGETFLLGAAYADRPPFCGDFLAHRPNGILVLMIEDHVE